MKASQLGFNPDYAEDAPDSEDIAKLAGEAVLEFGAPWCEHCQAARPAIEAVFTKRPTLPHIKVYDGKGKKLGRIFKVKLWPTLIRLKDGKEVKRAVRPLSCTEIIQLLD